MKKSKKVITLTVILSVIIVIISLFTIHYFEYKKDVSEIESIEIITGSGFPRTTCRYKIDFLNKSVMHETDKTFYTDFTDKDAGNFVKKADLYGFFSWKESYHNPNVSNAKCTNIYITFKDGTVKKTVCYAKFPLTYDIMAKVFEDTFGYNML